MRRTLARCCLLLGGPALALDRLRGDFGSIHVVIFIVGLYLSRCCLFGKAMRECRLAGSFSRSQRPQQRLPDVGLGASSTQITSSQRNLTLTDGSVVKLLQRLTCDHTANCRLWVLYRREKKTDAGLAVVAVHSLISLYGREITLYKIIMNKDSLHGGGIFHLQSLEI